MRINTIIVDDHPLFRQGVRLFFEGREDITILGEMGHGEEALLFLEENQGLVDVVVMDLQMPGMDGQEATQRIKERWPEIKVLVLTSYGSWDRIHSLLNSKASGYILKDAPPDELVAAIKAVYAGGSYFSQEVTKELLNRATQREEEREKGREEEIEESLSSSLIEPLTEREEDVLRLIGRGLGNKDIGKELHISNNTVKTHVTNIFQKLNVKTRTQAAFYAIQKGWVEP